MVGAVGLSSNGRLHLSFGLLKNWEESPPRRTLQVSRAGYLRPRTSGSISQLNLKSPFDVFRFQGLYKY